MGRPAAGSNICYNRYMALNLRSIEPELHRRLKLAAFSSGKALERFCLDALEDCLGDSKTQRQSHVRRESEQAVARVDIRARPIPDVVGTSRSGVRPLAASTVDVKPSYYVPAKYRSK